MSSHILDQRAWASHLAVPTVQDGHVASKRTTSSSLVWSNTSYHRLTASRCAGTSRLTTSSASCLSQVSAVIDDHDGASGDLGGGKPLTAAAVDGYPSLALIALGRDHVDQVVAGGAQHQWVGELAHGKLSPQLGARRGPVGEPLLPHEVQHARTEHVG